MYKPRVLHVDDEKDFLTLFSLTFGEYFDIVSVDNVKRAKELLALEKYEAIITDYEIKQLTGLELLKHIKEYYNNVPVIFYTGQGNEEIARESFISGAADYFVKNIDEFAHKEKIVNSIKRAIDKHKAEEAFKESEKRYKFIYDNSMEMHILLDMNLNIIDINKKCVEVLGRSKNDVVCKSILGIIVEEEKEKVAQSLENDLKGKYSPPMVVRIYSVGGIRKLLLREGAVIFKDDVGNPNALLISAIDVTELENIQTALRKREELLQAITFGARIAIVIINRSGRITYWNDEAKGQFQYKENEVVGELFHKIILPKRYHSSYKLDFEKFRDTQKKLFTGKTISLTAVKKNGNEFPIELSLSSVRLENTWHAVGVIRDITKQKKAEEELKYSQRRYLSLFECVQDAIFTISPEGLFMEVNPAFKKITGWSQNELIGKFYDFMIHVDDKDCVKGKFDRILENEDVGVYKVKFLTKSGSYKSAKIRLNPLIQDGKVIGVVGIGNEVVVEF